MRKALVALVVGLALTGATAVASADTITVVSDGAAFQATLDGPDDLAQLVDGVVDVAYDREGRLWYSQAGEGEFDSCSIGPADGATPPFLPGHLRPQMRPFNVDGVDCGLATDPRGGLLFEGSNHSLGSTSVWHLDTMTGDVRFVSWGYSPAASPDGTRLAVIRHTYRRAGGADERLALGALGRPRSVRPVFWARSGWSAPSFSPDGRLAAVRWTPRGEQLLVGVGGPPWRVLWKRGRGVSLRRTAWSRSGDLLVLASSHTGDGGNLYRFVGGAGPPQLFATDVTAFALGPDQTSPPVLAPAEPSEEPGW